MRPWFAVPLLLLLPLVWRAGGTLVRLGTKDDALARRLAPGVGLALWLLLVHAFGLLGQSFWVGLFAGTFAAAALGLWLPRFAPRATKPPPTSRWVWLGMAAAVLVLLGPEVRCTAHDETQLWAHTSTALQIQNGIYPPRNLMFPKYEFRYHYAVDLAAAVLSSLLGGLDMEVSIHLLALLLWGYLFFLLWTVGERLMGGKAAGPVTAFGVLFAGGASFFCRPLFPLDAFLEADCTPSGTWITPPLISNFLQHPWSLAFTVLACVLLVWPARRAADGWFWLLLSVLLAFLSFSEAVMFVCLLPSLVAVGCLEGWRPSLRRAARFVPWGLAMLLAARLLHGFFAPVAEPASSGVVFHPLWRDARLREVLAWNFEAMGLLLPLGVAGAFLLGPEAWLLAILAAGGLLVRNLFAYTHYSFDIVKFTMVSQVSLAVLSAAALSWAFSRPRWRVAGGVGLPLVMCFGLAWPLGMSLRFPGYRDRTSSHCWPAPPPPPAPDRAAIAFLRGKVQAGEIVYRTENAGAYSLEGGLPQMYPEDGAFGFSPRLFAERQRVIARAAAEPDLLLGEGIRWLVLGPNDAAMRDAAERWVQERRARKVAEFAPLKIYRLE